MGLFSKLFGGNDDASVQPKNEAWTVDKPAQKSQWRGTFYERKEACPDCDDVFLCDEHMAELKRSTKK